MTFLASIFGWILGGIYNLVQNYGIAIIIFSIFLKILLLPLSIKQQKTMLKSSKIQDQIKSLQFKYKNDPEKLNKEMMALYKSENMTPFSGCLSGIIQIVILLVVYTMVRMPLTYIKHTPQDIINKYSSELNINDKDTYKEITIIEKKADADENIKINMKFLGIDLSKIPMQNLGDPKVYILPLLYILSTFASVKINSMQIKKKEENKLIEEHSTNNKAENGELKKEEEEVDMTQQMNKNMQYMMPILSFSIALIAPLGLALYWLVSNILNIIERLILNKKFKAEEENKNAK